MELPHPCDPRNISKQEFEKNSTLPIHPSIDSSIHQYKSAGTRGTPETGILELHLRNGKKILNMDGWPTHTSVNTARKSLLPSNDIMLGQFRYDAHIY